MTMKNIMTSASLDLLGRVCDECDVQAEILITGKHDGCNYCGNEIALCHPHAADLVKMLSEHLPRKQIVE